MNKTQVWAEVLNISKEYDLSKEAVAALSNLLEPKKGSSSSARIIKMIDGKEYRNCRFTNQLWALDDLIYQNDEKREAKKDKGYSKIGISIWNKGQKYIKDLKDNLMDLTLNEEVDLETLAKLKEKLRDIKEKNLGNNPEWLVQFLSEDQLKELKNKSYPLDIEE